MEIESNTTAVARWEDTHLSFLTDDGFVSHQADEEGAHNESRFG
jgi:hypothetical protein